MQREILTYILIILFSLVELIKIDAEVEFANVERDERTSSRRIRPRRASEAFSNTDTTSLRGVTRLGTTRNNNE